MITIRLSEEDHKKIAIAANAVGHSINSFCLMSLTGKPIAQPGKIRGRKSKVLKDACQDSSSAHMDTDSTDTKVS